MYLRMQQYWHQTVSGIRDWVWSSSTSFVKKPRPPIVKNDSWSWIIAKTFLIMWRNLLQIHKMHIFLLITIIKKKPMIHLKRLTNNYFISFYFPEFAKTYPWGHLFAAVAVQIVVPAEEFFSPPGQVFSIHFSHAIKLPPSPDLIFSIRTSKSPRPFCFLSYAVLQYCTQYISFSSSN